MSIYPPTTVRLNNLQTRSKFQILNLFKQHNPGVCIHVTLKEKCVNIFKSVPLRLKLMKVDTVI